MKFILSAFVIASCLASIQASPIASDVKRVQGFDLKGTKPCPKSKIPYLTHDLSLCPKEDESVTPPIRKPKSNTIFKVTKRTMYPIGGVVEKDGFLVPKHPELNPPPAIVSNRYDNVNENLNLDSNFLEDLESNQKSGKALSPPAIGETKSKPVFRKHGGK